MGYYIYDLNYKPSSSERYTVPTKNVLSLWEPMTYSDRDTVDENGKSILKKTIIFPNASLINGGGKLRSGTKVKLLYDVDNPNLKFPNNTGVGFFIIPNGWNSNGIISNKKERIYTYNDFNYNSYVQSILLNDVIDSGNMILAFEDIMRPNGDKDFNDMIIKISYNPSYAVKNNDIIALQTLDQISELSYKSDKSGLYLKFPETSINTLKSSSANLKITQKITTKNDTHFELLKQIFDKIMFSSSGNPVCDQVNKKINITYNKNTNEITDYIYLIKSEDNQTEYSDYDINVKNIVQFQNHYIYDILTDIENEIIIIEDSTDGTVFYNQSMRPNTDNMGSALAMGDPYITTITGEKYEIPKNYRFVELYNDDKSLTIKISLSTYPNCIRQTKDLLFIDKIFVSYKNEYIIIDMFDPTKYYNGKSEIIKSIPPYLKY